MGCVGFLQNQSSSHDPRDICNSSHWKQDSPSCAKCQGLKCHCDKQPDPSGYLACDHGHINSTGGHETPSLPNSQASINPYQLINKPNCLQAYTATVATVCTNVYICTGLFMQHYQIYKSYNHIHQDTSCMQKHNWKTKLCHSYIP